MYNLYACTATRKVETLEATGSDDEGVLSSKNITVAAYVAAPLLAFALLACFCARRRSRDPDSARTAARDSWAKGGGAAGLGGLGGHAPRGGNGNAAVAGATKRDNGVPGSTKIFPASSSLSPKPERKNSRAMMNTLDLEDMNLAGDLVVGGGAPAAAAGASRGNGKKHAKAKKFARCESDTAFAVTSSEDVADAAAADDSAGAGGAAYRARGGAGTGRSPSPTGYDDDAAASAFDGGSIGRRMEEDDEMSESGWGSSYNARGARLSSGLPSYEETQTTRSHSNRERNSERTLARAAATAGRPGASRRADADPRNISLR